GAVGKSAQLPLQTWLPDAMAGPTPVSALIHAATMVTAGVYLIARLHGLFLLAPDAQFVVALVGAATLLLAAAAALVQTDLKRILAYSTMSQIGYMFLALGVGAWSAAIFHLVTHAFFKALLFLAAGSVILALHHEQDVRRMGGLRRALPVPFAAMVVGAAALAALPPTAGFASKDPILLAAFAHDRAGPLLWGIGVAGAVLTAVYATRMVAVVFLGERRTAPEPVDDATTIVPLLLLLLAALGGGWFGFDATAAVLPDGGLPSAHGPGAVAAVTVGAPLLAVLATAFAWRRSRSVAAEPGGGLRGLLRSGGGFDALYARLLERPFLRLAEAAREDWIDRPFAGVAVAARRLHELLVQTQNGALRAYATVLALGLAALLLLATGAG
ncbi:MAG: NADH-quinone oxidoreductase subunit L, partial [Pseudomonadales bacterium]|nr:NADH-quinone oxidoreductase subunit L [Pseudomonadales bacterium]